MILDKTAEFSDSQAVTATTVSANIMDLNPSGKNAIIDIGAGEDVELGLQVDTAFAGPSGSTLTVTLETDSASSLAVAPTVILTTAAIPVASLSAGYQIGIFKLPLAAYKRFMGCRFTVTGGPFTAGSVSAFLVRDGQTKRQYASGFTV